MQLHVCLTMAASCLLCAACRSQSPPPSTALSFQANSAHTGGVSAGNLKPPLKRLWSFGVPGSSHVSPVTPMVANGLVLGAADFGYDAPSGQYIYKVFSLQEATGQEAWPPITVPDLPYLGFDQGTLVEMMQGGELIAIDASTGVQKWQVNLNASGQGGGFVPPAIRDGVIYTRSVEAPDILMYAVKMADGGSAWPISTVIDRGIGFLALDDANIYGGSLVGFESRSQANGSQTWIIPGLPYTGTVAIYQNVIYASKTMIDASHQTVLGTYGSFLTPAFDGNLAVFNNQTFISAMDATTHEAVWKFTADSTVYLPPLIVNDVAYAVSVNGTLYALDVFSGRQLWTDTVANPIAPPTPDDQSLGFASDGNVLVVLTAAGYDVYGIDASLGSDAGTDGGEPDEGSDGGE